MAISKTLSIPEIGSDTYPAGIPNNGFIIRKSGRTEQFTASFGELKYFSSDTHTIYPPKLCFKWAQPIKQRAKQNFVGNGTLNDLLNETAQGDTNLNSGNAPVSLAEPFASGAPMPMETTGMPEEVANAVTRDYSDLMKAINKKKGN